MNAQRLIRRYCHAIKTLAAITRMHFKRYKPKTISEINEELNSNKALWQTYLKPPRKILVFDT